jgi:hypothetical protein
MKSLSFLDSFNATHLVKSEATLTLHTHKSLCNIEVRIFPDQRHKCRRQMYENEGECHVAEVFLERDS